MAFNAKEFGQVNRAHTYLKKSLAHSNKNTSTHRKAQLALAEIYYNKKDYHKAIPLYEQSLKKRGNKWWTKDAYNLAWCYFRTKRYRKALALMHKIHKLSGNGDEDYIDMRHAVERDLAIFYVERGQVDKMVSFYKKVGKNVGGNLMRLGRNLIRKKQYSRAKKVLHQAKSYQENTQERITLELLLIDLYERSGATSKHFQTVKKLMEYYRDDDLEPHQVKSLTYQVKKMAAILQRKALKSKKRKRRRKRANLAIQYFLIQGELTPSQSAIPTFHAAETLYALGDYEKAFGYYRKARESASEQEGKEILKIKKRALDGMMACLGSGKISASLKNKYLEKTYLDYIDSYPQSKKNFQIYQGLFSLHLKQKKIEEAEEDLWNFKKRYPKAKKTQEAMLTRIIDYHKEQNDRESIEKWVGHIRSGTFRISRKVARRLKRILLNLQFSQVTEAMSKGDKASALKEYIKIYEDSKSPRTAKKSAAYNASVLYYESGEAQLMSDWAQKAIALMNLKDIGQFETTFLSMATDLFNRRQFAQSAALYHNVHAKLCKGKGKSKSKNRKVFFKNAVILYLAAGKREQAQTLVRQMRPKQAKRNCYLPPSLLRQTQRYITAQLLEEKQWPQLQRWVASLSWDGDPHLIVPLAHLYRWQVLSQRPREAKKTHRRIMQIYDLPKRKGNKIPLTALEEVASFKLKKAQKILWALKKEKLRFPEARYDKILAIKFSLLDRLASNLQKVFEMGPGKGTVQAYALLIEGYRHLVDEITVFTPPGKSRPYVRSFKKTMRKLTRPIGREGQKYRRQAINFIKKNDILAPDNIRFLGPRPPPPLTVKFFPRIGGVLMDRGETR